MCIVNKLFNVIYWTVLKVLDSLIKLRKQALKIKINFNQLYLEKKMDR